MSRLSDPRPGRAPPGAPPGMLRGLWYYAVPGHRVGRGKMLHRTLLGEPVLIGRDDAGRAFALRDICPHRGIPLSYGRLRGAEVTCCYHGWRFDTAGRCTHIPSLIEGQKFEVSRIAVRAYPVHEAQGNIWIFMDDDPPAADADARPPVPQVPEVGDAGHDMVRTVRFACPIDHAVVGLMDPAHGPFVHQAWWWRGSGSIHAKEKRFAPSHLGFKMLRHAPSRNSFLYRLMGGRPETEISFQLPGIRIERVWAGDRLVCGLTAVTPVSESETDVTHAVYWNLPWMTPLKPLWKLVAKRFIDQDRRVVEMQQQGLKHAPRLMLINDADTQAKWYYRCKREFARARAEGRGFVNPVPETTLRWRS